MSPAVLPAGALHSAAGGPARLRARPGTRTGSHRDTSSIGHVPDLAFDLASDLAVTIRIRRVTCCEIVQALDMCMDRKSCTNVATWHETGQ